MIVSRNLKFIDVVVVMVGVIKGGIKYNIIFDEVILKLMVWIYMLEVCFMVYCCIKEIVRGVVIVVGLLDDKMLEVVILDVFMLVNYNMLVLVDVMVEFVIKVIGKENVFDLEL